MCMRLCDGSSRWILLHPPACRFRCLKLPPLRPLPPWGAAKEAEAFRKATIAVMVRRRRIAKGRFFLQQGPLRAGTLPPLRGYGVQRRLRESWACRLLPEMPGLSWSAGKRLVVFSPRNSNSSVSSLRSAQAFRLRTK